MDKYDTSGNIVHCIFDTIVIFFSEFSAKNYQHVAEAVLNIHEESWAQLFKASLA